MGRRGPSSTALSRTSQMIESSELPAPVAALANLAHQLLGKHWEALPSRYKLVVTSAMAFVLCNMVSTDISMQPAGCICGSKQAAREWQPWCRSAAGRLHLPLWAAASQLLLTAVIGFCQHGDTHISTTTGPSWKLAQQAWDSMHP